MSLSIFFARFFGFYLVIGGLFLLLRRRFIKPLALDFFEQPALVILSASFSLVLGLAVVLSHNVWESSWRVVITLLGYLLLLQGIIRLFTPAEKIRERASKFVESNAPAFYIGIISLIIGLFLLYRGYF